MRTEQLANFVIIVIFFSPLAKVYRDGLLRRLNVLPNGRWSAAASERTDFGQSGYNRIVRHFIRITASDTSRGAERGETE